VWLLYEGGTHIVRLDGEELAHATRSWPGGPPRGIASAVALYADLAASGRVRMYLATPMSLTECRPDELEDVYAGRPGGAPVPFGGRRAGEAR
jgi:hypothetical protein